MASTPFRFNFADRGSEVRPGGSEVSGAEREDPGSGSPTGPTEDTTDGSTGDASRTGAGEGRPVADAPIGPKRRKGPKPYPRTEDGRIIRPDGTIGPKSYAKADQGGKAGLAVGFIPNDRKALRENYKGIHEALAQLLMQPMLDITDEQAAQWSDSCANLFDRLEWNITGNGGRGNVYILAFMFALTTYRIEGEKVGLMIASSRARNVTPTAPATVAEATARGGARPPGRMDFSADIEQQVNANTSQGNGQYQFN